MASAANGLRDLVVPAAGRQPFVFPPSLMLSVSGRRDQGSD